MNFTLKKYYYRRFYETTWFAFENIELDKWDRLLAGWRINKRLKLGELSTGMLMKVKIGSVLARKAKLYLYDEPFASIDIMARSEVMKAIISETNPDAITIISSHHLEGTENYIANFG